MRGMPPVFCGAGSSRVWPMSREEANSEMIKMRNVFIVTPDYVCPGIDAF
jgi:hypothetical protein